MTRVTGLWVILLLTLGRPATAAELDLRLVDATAAQDTGAVRALLKQGVNVNAARADGATALLWAAHFNDVETVDLLIRAGANVNAGDDHGVTPLAQACENANLTMADRLLAAGASANGAQKSGLTPLMIAAHTNKLDLVRMLLAHGANVNAATAETKDTALMWAIADGHADLARALIEAHADVHASSTSGFTPLMFAARNGDINMAKALLAAGVKVNDTGSDGTHALPFSIVSGQGAFALFLIEQGADPNGDIDGVRALHTAAGNTALWLADWSRRHGGGNSVGVGLIATGRLDPNIRLTLVKTLLAKGADPNARITSSAMFMSYVGYPKKGAFEPFACGTGDLRGATPLWIAAYDANGDVGGFGGDGNAADAAAAAAGRGGRGSTNSPEIMRALLAGGADLRLTTDDGTNPLMVAAGLGRPTFSPGLQRGRRSLAAEDAVKILLDAGADIKAVNEADFTAIHGAAFRGLDEVIQILVDRGADINARDYRGRTPYRLAEGSKQSFQFQAYPETAEFIKKLGANTKLGIPGTVQERNRDVGAANANQKPQEKPQEKP
jgi:ankyrin repeat protein